MPEPQSPLILHPIRWTGAASLGLMLWVFVFLPFMPKEIWARPMILILTAILYCIGLAFFGVGFTLSIRSKWFILWWRILILGFILEMLLLGLIWVICAPISDGLVDPNAAFNLIGWIIRPLYWFSCALIAFAALVAARGWVDFFRWRRAHGQSPV
jgi:hypothetical protein